MCSFPQHTPQVTWTSPESKDGTAERNRTVPRGLVTTLGLSSGGGCSARSKPAARSSEAGWRVYWMLP